VKIVMVFVFTGSSVFRLLKGSVNLGDLGIDARIQLK
jgi:hypothetical protein